MATHDTRIERLTNEVLADRLRPIQCSAILIHNNPLTEVKLGNWAMSRYSRIRFHIDSSGGDDAYDKTQIARELDRLPLRITVGGLDRMNSLNRNAAYVFRSCSWTCMALVILFLFVEPAVGKEPQWKRGRLVDVSIDSYTKTAGVNGTIVSKRRKVWTYAVEDEDRAYFAEVNKALQLEVNTAVDFAVEKDRLYLKDSAGKTQKLDIVKVVKK